MTKYYKAMRKLHLPNGPGQIPSTTRVAAGEIFDLDGAEPIDVPRLIASGAIIPWHPAKKEGEHGDTNTR